MAQRMNGPQLQRRNTEVDFRVSQRRRNTGSIRRRTEEDDDDMRKAIEASKAQAEEDERKRRQAAGESDADIERAIKASREDEELRQSRLLEDQNANSLFDDSFDAPGAPQAQPVYQQQQQVDFWGNPIDMSAPQQLQQSTGYLQNVYSQPTGYLPPQSTGYMGQPQATNGFTPGFNTNNPYIQSSPTSFQPPSASFSSPQQTGLSNNPYAQPQPEPLQPMPTGSNNPFAQFGTNFATTSPQQQRTSFSPSLSTLNEQRQSSFATQQSPQPQSSGTPSPFTTPQKPQPTAHQNKLDYLLAQGNPTGQDTFGNTGELRVPAHFNRTGGFVNSAGQGLRPTATGFTPNNPFAGQLGGQPGANAQGGNPVRPLTQSSTGPAYSQSQGYGQYGQGQYGQNQYGGNQQGQTGSLIDF
jgi:epsin